MESVRKTFWILTVATAMFMDFTLLPISWIFLGFNSHISAATALFLTLVIAPLTAWLTIERLARDKDGTYYGWELDKFADWGKKAMLWGNPVGWLVLGIIWVLLKAAKRWPRSLGLFLACFL